MAEIGPKLRAQQALGRSGVFRQVEGATPGPSAKPLGDETSRTGLLRRIVELEQEVAHLKRLLAKANTVPLSVPPDDIASPVVPPRKGTPEYEREKKRRQRERKRLASEAADAG